MRRIISTAAGFLLAAAAHAPLASAQESGAAPNPVVVELYTSQGCSSCPPADELMERLAARPDIIPLALHVDYWDYIGWADEFADPAFTDRQKGYARAAGERAIYTPQMIVGGIDRVEGVRPMMVADLITSHRARVNPVQVRLAPEGDRVRIHLSAEPALPSAAQVHLVRYRPQETVKIERGENAGRTVTYHNIVTYWETIARWDGQEPFEMIADAQGAEPVVVIVQAPGFGPVLGAARAD
ncbi:DUF1223 domain-containing protein [Halodurantibacterium flavum]|uniref:DUF1223 domain-containing protein n=1 Tax=Halodurantibacterium flavum TaxID=1382802 RepID=A0ABW4S3V2_9RHOB